MVKFRRITRLLIGLLALGSTGCAAIFSPTAQPVSMNFGRVVFDCYYVNFAWGYTMSGFYIDQEGAMFRYDRGEEPWLPDPLLEEPYVVSAADLEAKFINSTPIGDLDSTLLAEKMILAVQAAAGEISREQVAADAGWSGCVVYRYHTELDGYSEIILGAGGDFLIRNSAPQAQDLLSWLQGLDTAP